MAKSKKKISKRIDRLSDLPDDILSIILSLLPTKFAVTTSVLSTRWKSLWTSITNLNFDLLTLSSKQRFRSCTTKQIEFSKFVNNVICQITPQRIQKFRLHFSSYLFHHSNLNLWITDIAPTVRELDLSNSINDYSWHRESLELDLINFNFSNLVVLNLSGGIDFKIPEKASVCFPNLTTLHLFKVAFSIAVDSSVSFPNLKFLQFHHVWKMDVYSVNKMFSSCPVLDHLDLYIGNDNYTEGLVLPSLTSLTLHLSGSYGRLCEMQLDKLSQLTFLSTSHTTLLFTVSTSTYNSWRFGYLKRLELEVHECSQFYPGMMISMLESMVNLEHLVLKRLYGDCSRSCSPSMPLGNEPLKVPECLLSRLTTLSISPAMDSCTNQVQLVRYVLMNAKVLQLLRLDTKSYDQKRKLILIEKLSMFLKGSQACQVELTSKTPPHTLIGSRV